MFNTIAYVIFFYIFILSLTPDFNKIKKIKETGTKEEHQKQIEYVESKFGDTLIKRAGITMNIQGQENIPDGPVLFVSNHQSYFDIPAFCSAINKQFGFIVKIEIKKIPVFSTWISRVESIFIDRDNPRESLKTIQEGIELLKNGYSIAIFPEGTRSKSATMGSFKKGSLRLAIKSKVPVVPITIGGTYKALEETGKLTPTTIDFIIHKPLYTKDMDKEELNNLSDTVEAIIKKSLSESIANISHL